jgi:small subunit ribosomal protein S20
MPKIAVLRAMRAEAVDAYPAPGSETIAASAGNNAAVSPVWSPPQAGFPAARRRALRSSNRARRSSDRLSSSTAGAYGAPLLPFARPRLWVFLSRMPNIKQQKKRVRTAAEERLENLRYRSTIKTLTKRLATVVEDGDSAAIETEHRELVKLIDRAVSRGALHRNAAARKKSQAARLAAGSSS